MKGPARYLKERFIDEGEKPRPKAHIQPKYFDLKRIFVTW
jgi:hypothetical protein